MTTVYITPSYSRRDLVTPADATDNLKGCRFLQNTGTAGSFIIRQNWGNVSAGNPNPFGEYKGSYPAVNRLVLSGGTGGAFTAANQPQNDGIEVISSDAGDTTQTVTLYGTTTGTNTVVVETVTLNGVTFVPTVKTDWGYLLGVEKEATTGTVTVREASGNATITTLTPAATSKGVTTLSPAGLDNSIPIVYASGSSTKVLGVVGTNTSGSAQYESTPLNGTTEIKLTQTFQTVTKLLVGDVGSSTTSYIKVGNYQLCYLTQGEFMELPTSILGVNSTSLGSGVVLYGMW